MEVALYVQEGLGELWALGTAEARQGPLLTILPTGKLVLAVTDLRGTAQQYIVYQEI